MPSQPRKLSNGAPGPPHALTDAVHEAVINATRAGAYRCHAAGYAGVHEDTLRRWLRDGARDAPKREDFADDLSYEKAADHYARCVRLRGDIESAESRFALDNLTVIRQAAATSWQAAAWLNERRFRDLYSLRHEVSGPDGAPVEIAVTTIEQMLSEPERAEGVADASIDAELARLTSGNGSSPE